MTLIVNYAVQIPSILNAFEGSHGIQEIRDCVLECFFAMHIFVKIVFLIMQDQLPYLDTPMDVNPVNTRQLNYPKIIDFLCDDVKTKKFTEL